MLPVAGLEVVDPTGSVAGGADETVPVPATAAAEEVGLDADAVDADAVDADALTADGLEDTVDVVDAALDGATLIDAAGGATGVEPVLIKGVRGGITTTGGGGTKTIC